METEHNVHNTLAIPVSEILTQPYMKLLAIVFPLLMICGDGVLCFIGFMYDIQECSGSHSFEDIHVRMSFNDFFKYGGIAGCFVGLLNVFPKFLKLRYSYNCCENENENETKNYENVRCKSLYHWSTGDGYLAIFIILWVVIAFVVLSEMNHNCQYSNPALLLQVWCAIKIGACVFGTIVLCVAAIVAANSGPKSHFH